MNIGGVFPFLSVKSSPLDDGLGSVPYDDLLIAPLSLPGAHGQLPSFTDLREASAALPLLPDKVTINLPVDEPSSSEDFLLQLEKQNPENYQKIEQAIYKGLELLKGVHDFVPSAKFTDPNATIKDKLITFCPQILLRVLNNIKFLSQLKDNSKQSII